MSNFAQLTATLRSNQSPRPTNNHIIFHTNNARWLHENFASFFLAISADYFRQRNALRPQFRLNYQANEFTFRPTSSIYRLNRFNVRSSKMQNSFIFFFFLLVCEWIQKAAIFGRQPTRQPGIFLVFFALDECERRGCQRACWNTCVATRSHWRFEWNAQNETNWNGRKFRNSVWTHGKWFSRTEKAFSVGTLKSIFVKLWIERW